MIFSGEVVTGCGKMAEAIRHRDRQFWEELAVDAIYSTRPYPGTLNLRLQSPPPWNLIAKGPGAETPRRILWWRCAIASQRKVTAGAVIRDPVGTQKEYILELISHDDLRHVHRLSDGDRLSVWLPDV